MKKIVFLIAFLSLFISTNAGNKGIQQTIKRIDGKRYIVEKTDSYALNEHILLVKLNPIVEQAPEELAIVNSNKLGFLYVAVPEGIDIEEYANDLKKDDRFDIVEFQGEIKCCFIPTDSYYNSQWYIDRINLDEAWDITTGNYNIKVAVIDTGVDADHCDLGYGNDSYSHVSTTLGYDYTANCTYQTPSYFHGTFVAGVLGAKTNNGVGVAGVSGGNNSAGITIIPYCLGNSNIFYSIHLADAIIDAVDKGASIINISLSSLHDSSVDSAILYAYNHNVSIVCATKNEGEPSIVYPASNQYTIAVGASGRNDHRCSFSNYGIGLDIVAPGDTIFNTVLSNGYASKFGNSFSAPQVSGVIALMLSVNPSLQPNAIRNILRNTATKVSGYTYTSGWNQEVGYGRLDAYAAVSGSFINISGANMVCTQEIFSISNMPTDSLITLNTNNSPTGVSILVSPNLNIYSYSNGSLTVRKISNGNGYIRVYYKGNLIAEKKVWVGAPVINNVYKFGMNYVIETDDASQAYDDSYYIKVGNRVFPMPGGMFSIFLPRGTYQAEAYVSNACGESDPYYTQIVIGNNINFSVSNVSPDGIVTITRTDDNGEPLPREVLDTEDKGENIPYTLTNSLTGRVVARGMVPIAGGTLDFSKQSKGFYVLTLSPRKSKEQSFRISL